MQHVPLPSVPRRLVRCASRLHESAEFPVSVPADTFAFLERLASQCDHSEKPLGRFLLLIRSSQLEAAILSMILPPEFLKLLTNLEERQIEKENAVAASDFDHAVELKRTTDSIKSQLAAFTAPNIELLPLHIEGAIVRLGFTGRIAT